MTIDIKLHQNLRITIEFKINVFQFVDTVIVLIDNTDHNLFL